MVPIGAVATFSDTTGPYRVPRYNLYPAAEVQLSLARGFSSGQGLAAVESIAAEKLPSGFGFEWTEIALQEKLAGNTAMAAFGLAVVFVSPRSMKAGSCRWPSSSSCRCAFSPP